MRRGRSSIQVIHVSGGDGWAYEHRGPDVPVFGLLLVGLGVVLLLDQVVPGTLGVAVSVLGVAVGATFLALWWRGGWGLYPGIFLIAISVPGLLEGLGLLPTRDGYGTFLLGAGLLAVAAFRVRDGRGLGWQGFLGLVLAIFGGLSAAGYASVGTLIWAALFIALGAVVLFRR